MFAVLQHKLNIFETDTFLKAKHEQYLVDTGAAKVVDSNIHERFHLDARMTQELRIMAKGKQITPKIALALRRELAGELNAGQA